MQLLRAGGGWAARVFAAALLFAGIPTDAAALPILRLFLQGEVDTLGTGGAEAFRDIEAETQRLERPALLADTDEVRLALFLENELTLALRAGPWAGTRADDQRLGLTAAIPLGAPLGGVPITLLAGVRRESGFTQLQSRKQGLLFRLEELREWAVVGLATSLPYGLRLGGALEQSDAGPRLLAEARFRPVDEGELWLRHRQLGAGYNFHIPDGAAKNLYSPELAYPIAHSRRDFEIGGSYALERFWAQGSLQLGAPFDYWLELGVQPLDSFTFKVGADRDEDRYYDRVSAKGTGSIAAVDLDLAHQRYFAGADVALGPRDRLILRYVYTRMESITRATEVGTNAAQAFLHVDYDFGLVFRSGHRIEGNQFAAGWRRTTASLVEFALGAQYFRLGLPPGAYELTSDALAQALVADAVDPSLAHLLGVTASIDLPIGAFRLGAAAAQLIPLAFEQPGAPAAPSQGKRGGSRASWVDRLAQGLRDYGGGNRLLLQLTTSF